MSFNTRSPAVKRLMKEAEELSSATELYFAQPLEDNLFEWHFTIRGPSETDFDGGVYHGRILLPAEYPMKPPSIIMLTHNGRFKVHQKICLSISGHHPETWLPSWSIRTALLALIGFMPTLGEGAVGSLDYTKEEREDLAKKSLSFHCSVCGVDNVSVLPSLTDKSSEISAEAKELAAQINFKNDQKSTATTASTPTANETPTASNPVENSTVSEPELTQRRPTSPPSAPRRESSVTYHRTERMPAAASQSEDNFRSMYLLFFVGSVFLFLLFRRIFLLADVGNSL